MKFFTKRASLNKDGIHLAVIESIGDSVPKEFKHQCSLRNINLMLISQLGGYWQVRAAADILSAVRVLRNMGVATNIPVILYIWGFLMYNLEAFKKLIYLSDFFLRKRSALNCIPCGLKKKKTYRYTEVLLRWVKKH